MINAREEIIQKLILDAWTENMGGTYIEEEIEPEWHLLRFYYDHSGKYESPVILIYHITETQKVIIESANCNQDDYIAGFHKRFEAGEYDKID